MCLPNYWPIEYEEERKNVIYACDYVGKKIAYVKAYIKEESVWFSLELNLENPDDFNSFLHIGVDKLREAKDLFTHEM